MAASMKTKTFLEFSETLKSKMQTPTIETFLASMRTRKYVVNLL